MNSEVIIRYVPGSTMPVDILHRENLPRSIVQLAEKKLKKMLHLVDVDSTWKRAFAPEFTLMKTEDVINDGRYRYFKYRGK